MQRSFEEVVRNIAASEEDVDKVLKAARLERHETSRMTGEQKLTLILSLAGIIALLLFFGGFIVATII